MPSKELEMQELRAEIARLREQLKKAIFYEIEECRHLLAENDRLRAALREITELRAEDMPHATEHSMAAAIAKAALHFSAVREHKT